jgi:inosine-uridine nucleoside N-ribohydrolase
MVGLDVTNRVLLTRRDRAASERRIGGGGPAPRSAAALRPTGLDAVALHDPLRRGGSVWSPPLKSAVIETRGQYTLGQTVADLRGRKYAPREVSPTRVHRRRREKNFSAG